MSGSTGHLKAKFVGNHGDKLTVGRLAAGAVNGVSEIGVQNIYVSAVPSHLYGMANGALYSGTGGIILLGHTGIQLLCHCIDDFRILYGHHDRISQIMVTFYMSRNADLVKDFRDLDPERRIGGFAFKMFALHGIEGVDAFDHLSFVERGNCKIGGSLIDQFPFKAGYWAGSGDYVHGLFCGGVF